MPFLVDQLGSNIWKQILIFLCFLQNKKRKKILNISLNRENWRGEKTSGMLRSHIFSEIKSGKSGNTIKNREKNKENQETWDKNQRKSGYAGRKNSAIITALTCHLVWSCFFYPTMVHHDLRHRLFMNVPRNKKGQGQAEKWKKKKKTSCCFVPIDSGYYAANLRPISQQSKNKTCPWHPFVLPSTAVTIICSK